MNPVSTRAFFWMSHSMEWFLLASAAVWFSRRWVSSHSAKWSRVLAIIGLSLNASVIQANGGTMPVVGLGSIVPASTLWQRAGAHSQLLFLADHASLYYFSLGDLFLIGGGIILVFCWLHNKLGGMQMNLLNRLWKEERAQDIAEYAVLLAVILVIVVGTIRLIGGSANNVFNNVSSALNQ